MSDVCAIVGGQWGDEGKGKLVDILAQKFDVIVRATGGANAGHTIYVMLRNGSRGSRSETNTRTGSSRPQADSLCAQTQKFVFHLVPAGMLSPKTACVMGNGMVVHLPTLLEEIEILKKAGIKVAGRLFLSDRAHLVFEYHKIIDQLQEEMKGSQKVGTTGRGIGPAYMDKTSRIGIRAGELKNFANFAVHYRRNLAMFKKMYGFSHSRPSRSEAKQLMYPKGATIGDKELRDLKKISKMILPFIVDTSLYLANAMTAKKSVLLEGANGTLLDIDHGTFPYVTSSNASIGGIIAGSGIAPSRLTEAIAIMKAYVTRVGAGPFPTELKDALGDKIREIGNEFGATTGRPRRCGWFDAVAAQYSVRLNGFSAINLTKVDVLSTLPKLKIGMAYIYKGKKLAGFPADLSVLEQCRVQYIEMPGWQEDISTAKKFLQLPKNCRAYIEKLEKLIGCPIRYIGTGRRREEMIFR